MLQDEAEQQVNNKHVDHSVGALFTKANERKDIFMCLGKKWENIHQKAFFLFIKLFCG